MESRQPSAGSGPWDRPRHGGSQASHSAEYQHGQPGSSLPTNAPYTASRQSRPGSQPVHHPDTRVGGRQHGAPQYTVYPQGERPDPFQHSAGQHGDFQSTFFHHGRPDAMQSAMSKDRLPPQQVISGHNPHQSMLQAHERSHGGPQSMSQNGGPQTNISQQRGAQQSMSQQRGGQINIPQHGNQQPDLNRFTDRCSGIFQHVRPQQIMLDYRTESSGTSHHGGPQQNILEYNIETQSIALDRNSQQAIPNQGEIPLNIQQDRGLGSTISLHDAQKSDVSKHGDFQSRGTHFGGPQFGQLQHDLLQHKDAQPHSYQFGGSQHGGSFSDVLHHSNPQQSTIRFGDPKPGVSSFGGSQAGMLNPVVPVNRPQQNDIFRYRAPSPGTVHQCPTLLQPVPPQTTPYVDNTVQGHHNFPLPFHENFTNPSFPVPPPVFSGYHKESDLKVPHLQAQVNDPQNVFNQELLNVQRGDRFDNRDMFNVQRNDSHLQHDLIPGQLPSERVVVQNKPFGQKDRFYEHDVPFLQQDIPDLQRDPHFLHHSRFSEQHGGPFVPHNIPNLQVEDNVMLLNRQSDMPLEKNGETYKDSFQQWLSSFLACQRKKPSPKPDAIQSISIPEAHRLIYGALQLVSQLDSLCQTLENEAGESWTRDYEKASDIRIELERKLKELEKPGHIQSVKKKLDRVRKKRLRWQRRREAMEEEDKVEQERAAEKEATIDSWRMQCIHAVEEKKRERELKAAADGVLAEVRKKQSDAKKMLDVLKSLEKLRKLRKEAAGRKGVFPPASADDTFKNHTDKLRTMVHKRTALYDAEERALRVILEGEQEEERQRDKDKRLRKEKEKVLQKQRELDSILFGDPEPLPNMHPLQPFRQYYLQAENSVVSLVQIRHAWDQYLVPPDHPNTSSIPRGWVVPTLPSSDIWATALKQAE
ncbi:programmed cell death protein 7 [Mixophyes fleayi]|uniref:programmed cell death protein 7 n=1 Tax=Mixophyes fleayi TaxID=3061075 RepID=UPI003F4D8215